MSSLREITEDLKRYLEEKEVWTLLYLSAESLKACYRDFQNDAEDDRLVGPCLIISVDCLFLYKAQVQFSSGLQSLSMQIIN
jgi:hypothetical protein